MFKLLPRFWTPILRSADVGATPVGTRLAGEKIVLFRHPGGVAALLDACPHRGVALSLGRVVDGCLQCPFHGWRFDAAGRACVIPFNPDQAGQRGTVALPVREIAGLIWVFTGTEADGEPNLPESVLRPGTSFDAITEEWRCHWTRAMENMLDTPHLPFVHRRTIGSDMARRAQRRMTQRVEPTPGGFIARFEADDAPPGRIDWLRPNAMELHISDGPSRFFRNMAWCVPLDEHTTRMIVLAAWDFGWLSPLFRLGRAFNRRVLTEDRDVLESSDPPCVPPPSAEQHVPTDVVTLRFRSWYFEHIAGE